MAVLKVEHCQWQLFSVQEGRQSWGVRENTFTLIFSTTGCLRTHGNTMERTHSVLTHFVQSHLISSQDTHTVSNCSTHKLESSEWDKRRVIPGKGAGVRVSNAKSVLKKWALQDLLQLQSVYVCCHSTAEINRCVVFADDRGQYAECHAVCGWMGRQRDDHRV